MVIADSGSVHPRLRGELDQNGNVIDQYYGSSPLTRGTHWGGIVVYLRRRFIPAYAGNSCLGLTFGVSEPVHPRLRGELDYLQGSSDTANGSSPLTRGTRFLNGAPVRIDRFIPAYAGNSGLKSWIRSAEAVHPRLRGELARSCRDQQRYRRFIPAYAGNSLKMVTTLH